MSEYKRGEVVQHKASHKRLVIIGKDLDFNGISADYYEVRECFDSPVHSVHGDYIEYADNE